jgi:outer membrane cobalamin receptor
MKIRPAILAISVILASAFTLGVALQVKAQGDKMQQPQAPTQQTEFDQSQLESFASAVLEIKEIRSKWQSRIQEAESDEKIKEFQAQAGTEMVNAVEAKGLTVETYNAIAASPGGTSRGVLGHGTV